MLKPPPKAPDFSIHDAARSGNVEGVRQHLAAGTPVDLVDREELTPLIRAVFKGHIEVVELLIDKGADVNSKNQIGYTPLDEANFSDYTEIGDLLRKHGGKTGEELKAEGK